MLQFNAPLAQLDLEYNATNVRVGGSSPSGRANGVYDVAVTFRIVIPASPVRTRLDTPLDILVKRCYNTKMNKEQKKVWTILSTPDDIDFRKFREKYDDFWLTKEREVLHIGSMETKHVQMITLQKTQPASLLLDQNVKTRIFDTPRLYLFATRLRTPIVLWNLELFHPMGKSI